MPTLRHFDTLARVAQADGIISPREWADGLAPAAAALLSASDRPRATAKAVARRIDHWQDQGMVGDATLARTLTDRSVQLCSGDISDPSHLLGVSPLGLRGSSGPEAAVAMADLERVADVLDSDFSARLHPRLRLTLARAADASSMEARVGAAVRAMGVSSTELERMRRTLGADGVDAAILTAARDAAPARDARHRDRRDFADTFVGGVVGLRKSASGWIATVRMTWKYEEYRDETVQIDVPLNDDGAVDGVARKAVFKYPPTIAMMHDTITYLDAQGHDSPVDAISKRAFLNNNSRKEWNDFNSSYGNDQRVTWIRPTDDGNYVVKVGYGYNVSDSHLRQNRNGYAVVNALGNVVA